jgi:hypothetical protein
MRKDLQNPAKKIGDSMTPKTPPSNQYGESAKLMRGLKQVPMGQSPTAAPPQIDNRRKPGKIVDLLGATTMPNQPITAGADFGPGPTSFQAGMQFPDPRENAIVELRNISQMFPDSGIADILDKYSQA